MQRLSAGALAVIVLTAGASAGTWADPAVPPGKPASGIAVALIGGGIDYTQPAIAAMLARDGEGELIGYDVRDDDRRPFPHPDDSDIGTRVAETIGTDAPKALIVPVRADMAGTVSLARALAYVSHSPAQMVFVQFDSAYKTGWDVLARAAKKFETLLFVVAAGDDGIDLSSAPGDAIIGNVLVVAAAGQDGILLQTSNHGPEKVDIAAVVAPGSRPGSQIAAARILALAARMKAAEPGITAGALKSRITDLAKKTATSAPFSTKYGVIADDGSLPPAK